MARKFFSFVFAFLLLGLQQQLLLHPLTQLPEARQHSSLKLPAIDIACVECSLLASTTHAAAGSPAPAACNAAAAECIAFEPTTVAAPSYYQSRAPTPPSDCFRRAAIRSRRRIIRLEEHHPCPGNSWRPALWRWRCSPPRPHRRPAMLISRKSAMRSGN